MFIILGVLSGMFCANACPHFIKGVCGERFRTPFARGEKNRKSKHPQTSSPIVNVVWAFCNLLISGIFGFFTFSGNDDGNLLIRLALFGAGFFLFSLVTAKIFADKRGVGGKSDE